MNIDPNISRVWASPEIDETVETDEIDEAKLSLLESEELQQSTIERAEQQQDRFTDLATPILTVPNYDVINEAAEGIFSPEDLTDDVMRNYLDDFPEFTAFLGAQNLITESDIYDYVRQKILENLGSSYSLEALAATALAERMYDVWKATDDSTVKEMWDTIRYDILKLNNPTAQVLIESKTRDLIAQGMSVEEAKQRAIVESLHDLDVELSENGVITPYYGTHPKMDAAIGALLLAHFGDATGAQNFVNSIQDLVGMEQNLINLFAGIQQIQTTGVNAGKEVINAHKNILGSAQQLLDEAMEALKSVPLPENQRTAILDFMQKISEALALLDRIMNEIGMSESQRSKAEFGAKIDSIMTSLKAQLEELRKAMRKIRKAKKKAKKFGKLGKIMNILNKVMAAVMMVAILLAMVAMLGLMVVAAPLAILALIGLGALFVGVVVSLAMSETGETDKMMDAFFEFAFMTLTEVLGLDVDRETAGLIMIGVVGAIAVLPILLSVVLLPLLLVLLPLLLVLAPLLIGPAILIFGVIILIAIAMSTVLAPLVIQFLPEMILRSGLLETIAAKIGKELGMSEGQINDLETTLRGAVAMVTVSTGMNVSSSFGKLDADDQSLVDTEEKKKGKIWEAKSKAGRVAPYQNIGQVKTLNDLAAMRAASPEAMKERQEELQEMIALLRKVIEQLKKILAALMGGGDPAEIGSAIKEIQKIIDTGMSNFITPSGNKVDLKPIIMPIIENTLQGMPNVLPSEEAIKEQLRKVQERSGFEADEEQDFIRMSEILS